MLKKPEDKKQLGDFFGMSNSYAECYPATYVRLLTKGGWDNWTSCGEGDEVGNLMNLDPWVLTCMNCSRRLWVGVLGVAVVIIRHIAS